MTRIQELEDDRDAALAKVKSLEEDVSTARQSLYDVVSQRNAAVAERDAAVAENVLLRRVADAAKDVIRFTEPEWRNDVDRGDADTKLAETVAALRAHVEGETP